MKKKDEQLWKLRCKPSITMCVCDQSGECELQNYSLYMKVDSQSL